MINRRDFLGTLGAGAALALTPDLLRAFEQANTLLQRAHPSSGERFPVVSLGARPTDDAAMRAVLRTLLDTRGRVVDVLHGGPAAEEGARNAAAGLGIQDQFFWTTPVTATEPPQPGQRGGPAPLDAAAVKAQVEEKLARFKVPRIDLVMAPANAAPSHLAALRDLKKDGRIRYVGVHWLLFPPNAPAPEPPTARLEAVMRSQEIDFIGTDYSVGDRRLEDTVMPLALERKIGVLAYFPFDRGRLFQRASQTPLPEWAAEFGATTWAQFFLKYVISHPAVVMARTGTTKAAHLLENLNAGMGRLPDEAMRKRMAQLVDGLPPTPPPGPPKPPAGPTVTLSAAVLDRYVGQYVSASGFTATIRREGDRLIVKPGTNPEAPLTARSETVFQDPRGPFFEFQVDAQGVVTGAVLEQQTAQGPQRIPLVRK